MATYAYARISIDDANSVSINDQLAKINAYAFAQDRSVDDTFVDEGVSGKTLNRPSAQALLAKAQPGDVIIVNRLDRLTRSVRDVNDLMDRGLVLVSVVESLDTSTATGRMIVNMLGTFAQFERELIVERTTASLDFKRRSGANYCFAPFGYRNGADGRREPIPEELELIGAMSAMRGAGKSYQDIANFANASGIKPHRADKWAKASVHAMLNAKVRNDG